jgi:uncharacterized protein YggU (UPF0235/DUF167 family)
MAPSSSLRDPWPPVYGAAAHKTYRFFMAPRPSADEPEPGRSEARPATARLAVRVKPGAARERVGGSYGDSGALVVAVMERAVDGKATAAVLRAVAAALGVPRSAVTLRSGAASRDKVLVVTDPPEDFGRLVRALRG